MAKEPRKETTGKPSESGGLVVRLRGELCLAWRFFTRFGLPFCPAGEKKNTTLAHAASVFALVGLIIGAVGGLVLWVTTLAGFNPLAAAIAAVAAVAVLTGALHEDGLADVADGFGGGATKTAKLAIMKDSRIGTFGVLALVLSVGFKVAVLAGMPGAESAIVAMIAAHTLSRAGLPLMMARMKPARRGGLGKAAGRPSREDGVIAALIGLLLVALVVGPMAGYGAVLLAGLAAGLVFEGVAMLAQRQIGGLTGDVLGAAQQLVELAVLATLAMAMQGAA